MQRIAPTRVTKAQNIKLSAIPARQAPMPPQATGGNERSDPSDGSIMN